jgi:hypothetical protein
MQSKTKPLVSNRVHRHFSNRSVTTGLLTISSKLAVNWGERSGVFYSANYIIETLMESLILDGLRTGLPLTMDTTMDDFGAFMRVFLLKVERRRITGDREVQNPQTRCASSPLRGISLHALPIIDAKTMGENRKSFGSGCRCLSRLELLAKPIPVRCGCQLLAVSVWVLPF